MRKKDDVDIKNLYDPVMKQGLIKSLITGEKARRIGTALVYERIGNQDVLEGCYGLLKGSQTKIFGEYCILRYKKKNIFVDVPSSEDFVPCKDRKLGKIIEFVKFADDDFRILKRLNENFYYKGKVPKMKTITEIDEETNEEYTIKAQETDDEGQLVYEDVNLKYEQPKGISQEARDVIRQGNEYERKKEEYRKRNQSFFEKYKEYIIPVTTLAICFLMVVVTLKFTFDGLDKSINSIDDLTDKVSEQPWYANEDSIRQIANKVTEIENEENNPPT